MTLGKISIIGFGKIGQAFAAHVLRAGGTWGKDDDGSLIESGSQNTAAPASGPGHRIQAIDRDINFPRLFQSGKFTSTEPGVNEVLLPAFASGHLQVSPDFEAIEGSVAIIIAIPLSVDDKHRPDSQPFIDTIIAASPFMQHKLLLVIETSLPVGFCRSDLVPALAAVGKEHGRDYLLAHSPERIKSVTMLQQLESVPKIIGGYNNEATAAAVRLYSGFFKASSLVAVGNIESAEMVKMAGMMYRDLNIALANQLAMYASAVGVDLVSLLPLVNSDGEARLLQPGIGVGGHCTPVYPYFMIDSFSRAGLDFTLASEARRINEQMSAYAVSLADSAGENKTVLVLGLSFRPGIREDAFSPAYRLVSILREKGLRPLVHDPVYSTEEITAKGFDGVSDLYMADAAVIFLVTMHAEYESLDFKRLAAAGAVQLIDGRNRISRDAVESAGIKYRGIGR